MTPGPLPLSLLALPVAALSLLAAPRRRTWRAGAEHSRWFWSAWVLIATVVGLAGWARLAGAGGLAWLALCCGVGSAQPSMIADLVDVRRLGRRRRAHGRRRPVLEGGPRPIHWRAPATADGPAWVPQAQAS